MSETDKKYTLKGVQAEKGRLAKVKDRKLEKIKELNAEIREINKQLKDLDTIHDQLYQEDMQRQFMAMFPKGEKLTAEQMQKFMMIGKQVLEKIDILDADAAAQAIGLACEESSETDKTTLTSALQASGNVV